jgi:O-antigen/teichoic acid export membrane protein
MTTITTSGEDLIGPRAARPEFAAVARGGAASIVGAVVAALANFALVVVVAHGVDKVRAGQFFALISVFLVAELVCRLGADTSLVYFVARWLKLDKEALIRPGLQAAFVPAGSAAILTGVTLFVFAPQAVNLVVKGPVGGDAATVLRVLAVFLPVAVCYDLVIGATRGFGTMRPTVLVEKMGRPVLQLALVWLAVVAGWHASLPMAWVAPYAAALVAAFWMLHRLGVPRRAPRRRYATQRRVSAEFWKFTAPRAVAGVAQMLMQRLDIILVAALVGLRAAAIYTAATRFIVVGQLVNQAVSAPVQPRLSALLAVHDRQTARALYRVSTTWLVLLMWPLFGACIALAPTYLAVFGRGYGDAVAVVVLLSASMLLASACGLVDSVIIMAGRTSWNLATTLFALAVNVGVDVWLIPNYGIIGAAIGWCAAVAASNLPALALAWFGLGLHPFGTSVGVAILLTGVCFVAVPIGVALVSGSQLAVAIVLALATAVLAAVVWRMRDLFALEGLLRRRIVVNT